ncbi:MAG TPA: Gfo/Idh/MocA family oxidoreductase [Chthoniobacter sp.]|jgi:predicted dehydrogenase
MTNDEGSPELKIGMIGLDTSHCVAFAEILHNANAPGHVPGARVTAAVKTFSPDMEASASRVDGYARTMQEKHGVKLLPAEELCEAVDAVMIVSLDGRAHLEQARAVIAAKKPLFIDKPIAATLRDVIEIFRLARKAGTPVFSSSAYRFYESLVKLRQADVGEVRAAISYGSAYLDARHPDLFFYGIHPAEALYAVLGRGCESVVRTHTADSDVVTGTWSNGRVGVLHGLRTQAIPHKVIVFGSTGFAEQQPTGERFSQFGALGAAQSSGGDSYVALLHRILDFFRTGVPPVTAEETIELFTFLEAAEESKRRGGQPVKLSEVLRPESQ